MKKIISLSIFFVILSFTSSTLSAQCTYTLDMYDSWGDGWNGGFITININGVATHGPYACVGSASSASFSANNADVVEIIYTAGSSEIENSYDFIEGGTTLFSDSWPNTGSVYTTTCGGAVAPSNDDCSGAIALTVNPDLSCTAVTSGTVFSSTASPDPTATTCFGTADDDVWYSFVATSTEHNVSLTNVAGSNTDMYHSVYEMGSGCPGLGAEIICNDNDNSALTGLTIGNTYYVRVYTWTSTGGQNTTFDICVTTPVPCSGGAGGNDCAQQQPICTDNSYCYTAGIGSTASSGNDYGCLLTQPNPSWYYFEISTSGDLIFDLGAGSDIDYAVWGPFANAAAASAACGSLSTPVDCSYSTSPTEQVNVTGVSVGEVYIMVVTNFASVVQDITLGVSGGNTAATNCAIVNPTPCNADAGNW
jgi:hypothetical protein